MKIHLKKLSLLQNKSIIKTQVTDIGEALAETMLRSRLARACNPTEDGKARHGGLSAKAKEITT